MNPTKQSITKNYLYEGYRYIISGIALVMLINLAISHNFSARDLMVIPLIILVWLFTTKFYIRSHMAGGVITVSDCFFFVAAIMLGTGASVIVAASEPFFVINKLADSTNKQLAYFVSSNVIKVWMVLTLFSYWFGEPITYFPQTNMYEFIIGFIVIALLYYFFSLVITTLSHLFNEAGATGKIRTSKLNSIMLFHFWSGIINLVTVSLAGVFYNLLYYNTLLAFFISFPLLFITYFTFNSYFKAFDSLGESESKFRSSFDHAPIGMAVISQSGEWIEINDSLRSLLAISKGENPEKNYRHFVFKDDIVLLHSKIRDLMTDKVPSVLQEIRLQNTKGEVIWGLLGSSKIKKKGAKDQSIILQFLDMTSRRNAEEQLRYKATHDSLTKLPNRSAFLSELQEAINNSEKNSTYFATLFVDLDNFKLINDSLGHNVGDEVLSKTASRLSECVQNHDFVARLGGDEFTILLRNLSSPSDSIVIAKRILEKFGTPIKIDQAEFSITLSIGITTSANNYKNASDMLRDADASMYQAKAKGRNCLNIFDQDIINRSNKKLRVINELPKALQNDEIILYYQPIIDLSTNQVVAFEALSRWNHPKDGLLSAFEFIPPAEEYGLITKLDDWVILNSCRKLAEWHSLNPKHKNLKMSYSIK